MNKHVMNIRLIQAVRKYECLYNKQSPKYKKVAYKDHLWHEIAKLLGITSDLARQKWKNLRDSYKRFVQKTINGKDFYKPYKYADELKFLNNFNTSRSCVFIKSADTEEVSTDLSSDNEYLYEAPVKQIKPNLESSLDEIKDFFSPPLDATSTDSANLEIVKTDIDEVPLFKIKSVVTENSTIEEENNETTEVPVTTVQIKSVDHKERLIEEIRKHECIYNLQCPEYKDYIYKDNLWRIIGKRVGISGAVAKTKWKSLRDSYKKYREKAVSEGGFIKPYKYADSLKFLENFSFNRPSKCRTNESYLDEEVSTDLSSNEDIFQYSSEEKTNNFTKPYDEMADFLGTSTTIENMATETVDPRIMTTRLFVILASKINSADLTMQEKNDIEFAVSSVVYSKLAEYDKNKTKDLLK